MATRPTNDLLVWANTDVNLPNLAGPNKTEPSADLVAKGWDFKQKPSADEFNYILNNLGEWVEYLKTVVIEVTPEVTPEATPEATANTLALRDASGNFAANVITSNLTGDVTGNADTATKWQTPMTLTVTGGATGTVTDVDGSSDITLNLSLPTSVTNIRLGTRVSFPISSAVGTPQYEAGYVLTGATNDGNLEVDTLYTRPIQQYINGTWYTIGNI